ncbi:FAD-dependent oxidoreductase [Agrobacterium rhizogenes]|uniref:GcvT family protein n=1 Tax=Rhizobium rhizogenes TaxID=359 RepID=UPI00055C435E|nr:FAD-dependent oxidoreductase [Rhizobium rhizogenes]NTF83168.1 FAD-dependent oxidoreductase [Rhizobium rhizogenes]NTH79333.1 FAD-dependent oxidoreductase [Rhizobium rhizogenes]NTH85310.1 FAD-dependent oxidoreductase [Rhizobium rhizogenes]NTI76137.1 FAD-dependent oxidoreductase [Rhizobium rhizogenes]
MQTHARAVVIGGGCVGAAILYGLAKRGWTDVALLERTQLTAGSTWHAAGLIPSYARSINIGRMIAKTIEIYEGLEVETGQHVGWHKCGQLRIANTRDRLDEYKSYMSVAAVQGIRAELVTPQEARRLWPLLENNHDMLAALYHPDDGHIAPADVTQAMAKGARDRGAKIYLNTEVRGFERMPGGEWKILTNNGEIICEHVISATGNYARQTGAMLGLEIPAIPIVHQYWITDAVPEVIERKRQGLPEMPILRDEAFEGYLREEGDGLMFGPYERTEHLKLFAENGVPEWFGADLLEEDFDSVSWNWERAMELVPALGRVGIKANVRGPFQMTADELPLVGPAWGLENVWIAEGVPGGILWGGAIGYYLSERIVEGANSLDTSELDPRRFGDYANKEWTRHKVRESWGTHAEQHYPGQDMPAARPQKTAPSYDILTKRGAVWGVLNGWEMPNWFAPQGVEARDQNSWRWTEKGKYVGEEVHAVRNTVGLVEMTPMTKFEISGPGAEAWLDGILANRLPKVGRVNLSHHLTRNGGVQAEYIVSRLEDGTFYLISTPRAERWNFDDLSKLLPKDGTMQLRNATNERGCFTIVGPKAREVLQGLTEMDLSNEAFPWFGVKSGTVGLATDVRLLRVNYEGELGWELYHPLCYQRHLLEALLAAGVPHGLRLIGLQALESLRLEKSYRAMYRDMNPELTAWESGLDRFIRLDKGEFIGRGALLRQKEQGVKQRSVTISIDTDGASSLIHEGVYRNGKLVGRITSGGYAYTLGYDVAFALLPVELGAPGTELEVPILGEMRKARVIPESPYDPDALRGRM